MTISTTIKRKWLDKILCYEKLTELKGATDHWRIRLDPHIGLHIHDDLDIIFICGREVVRFNVLAVTYRPKSMNIDGVDYDKYYIIALGKRLRWPRMDNRG